MCDYDNNCNSGLGSYNGGNTSRAGGCGLCNGFGLGNDNMLIIAIIILFILLFGNGNGCGCGCGN